MKTKSKNFKKYYILSFGIYFLLAVFILFGLFFDTFKSLFLSKPSQTSSPTVKIIKEESKNSTSKPSKSSNTSFKVSSVSSKASSVSSNKSAQNQSLASFLILVNKSHLLPEDFSPNLTTLSGGLKINKDAGSAFTKMTAAAKKDGITIKPISGYRTVEYQENLFNTRLAQNKAKGMTEKEAYEATAQYTAPYRSSEHCTGLAVDVNQIDESFEKTPAFKWLIENCSDYGFILRYPKTKSEITKINYEPWHFRFVGVEVAKKIMDNNICFEEYLEKR